MGYDVFISYSSKDRQFATALSDNLEKLNIKCWIDRKDLRPGEQWRRAIVDAIKGNPDIIMVLIFSSSSNESRQVVKELGLADNYKIIVIPVRIENIKPTNDLEYELSGIDWMDAFENLQHIESIAENIKQNVLGHKKIKTDARMSGVDNTSPVEPPTEGIIEKGLDKEVLNTAEQKYYSALKIVYEDGQMTETEKSKMEGTLEVLEIPSERASEIEKMVMIELGLIKSMSEQDQKYVAKLKEALIDGQITEIKRAKLEGIMEALDISHERARELEEQVKKELTVIPRLVTEQVVAAEGVSYFGDILFRMAEELNTKHQSLLQKLNSTFQTKLDAWVSIVYTNIYIGPLSFCLVGGYYSNTYVVEFWDTTDVSGSKFVAIDWINKYFKSDFPNFEIKTRNKYGYIRLWSRKLELGVQEDIMKELKTRFIASCDVLLPKLTEFYDKKIETVNKLVFLTDKIVQRLEEEFPSKGGWTIENTALKLAKWSYINVSKREWNKKIVFCIAPNELNFNQVYFGLKRGTSALKYKDGMEDTVKSKFDEFFGDKGKSDWWIAWTWIEKPYRSTVRGNFVDDDFIYLLDSQEKEQAFIGAIVEKLVKMKEFIPLIDEMVK